MLINVNMNHSVYLPFVKVSVSVAYSLWKYE